jgi:5-methylcytosine-specific restriction endonuclease McrA
VPAGTGAATAPCHCGTGTMPLDIVRALENGVWAAILAVWHLRSMSVSFQCSSCKRRAHAGKAFGLEDFTSKHGYVSRCHLCREKDSKRDRSEYRKKYCKEHRPDKKYRENMTEEQRQEYLARNAENQRNRRVSEAGARDRELRRTSANTRIKTMKASADKRKYKWLITDDFACRLMNTSCFYCGHVATDHLNGIDRMDSRMAYIPENCVASCADCNKIKGTMKPTSFVALCHHCMQQGSAYTKDVMMRLQQFASVRCQDYPDLCERICAKWREEDIAAKMPFFVNLEGDEFAAALERVEDAAKSDFRSSSVESESDDNDRDAYIEGAVHREISSQVENDTQDAPAAMKDDLMLSEQLHGEGDHEEPDNVQPVPVSIRAVPLMLTPSSRRQEVHTEELPDLGVVVRHYSTNGDAKFAIFDMGLSRYIRCIHWDDTFRVHLTQDIVDVCKIPGAENALFPKQRIKLHTLLWRFILPISYGDNVAREIPDGQCVHTRNLLMHDMRAANMYLSKDAGRGVKSSNRVIAAANDPNMLFFPAEWGLGNRTPVPPKLQVNSNEEFIYMEINGVKLKVKNPSKVSSSYRNRILPVLHKAVGGPEAFESLQALQLEQIEAYCAVFCALQQSSVV